MKCAWSQLVAALLLCAPCFGQEGAQGGTERQTKLVVPGVQPEAAPELVMLPVAEHRSEVRKVAFSRDERTLVTCSESELIAWDLAGRYARWSVTLPGDPSQSRLLGGLATSPDGRLVALVWSHAMHVWDTRTGGTILVRDLADPHTGGTAGGCVRGDPAFSPDGRLIALPMYGLRPVDAPTGAALAVSTVQVWDIQTSHMVAEYATGDKLPYHPMEAEGHVAFRPDGSLVAAFDAAGSGGYGAEFPSRLGTGLSSVAIMPMKTQEGAEISALAVAQGGICFSADGQWLAERSDSWFAANRAPGRPPDVSGLDESEACRLRRTSDWSVHGMARLLGERVATVVACSSRQVMLGYGAVPGGQVVDMQTGKMAPGRVLSGPYLALSPSGTLLATPAGVFEVGSGRPLLSVPMQDERRVCCFVADERLLVSSLRGGEVLAVRRTSTEQAGGSLPLPASARYVYHDSFVSVWTDPDGLYLLPTGPETAPRGFVPAQPQGYAARFLDPDMFAREGVQRARVLGLRADGTVMAAGQYHVLRHTPQGVFAAVPLPESVCNAFSPGAGRLVSFGSDGVSVSVLDISTGMLTGRFSKTHGTVNSRFFLEDGRTLVFAADESVSTPGHEEMAPDVETCGVVRVFDVDTGECTHAWLLRQPGEEEFNRTFLLAVSPEGSWALSQRVLDESGCPRASWVVIHALQSGEAVAHVPGRAGTDVVSADFRSDGDRLVLAYGDGLSTLWDLSPLRTGGEGRLLSTLADWSNGEWATVTPQGYVDCSPGGTQFLAWRLGEGLYPFEQFAAKYRRPDLVRRALAGEDISSERGLSGADVPPTAVFLAPEYDATIEGETARVEIEVVGVRPLARVDLLIDGRPIPDELAATAKWEQIEGNHGVYTFELPLSQYQRRTRLQAIVHDAEGLQSMPAEVTFTRAGAPPPATVLHALSIGVSTYRREEWNNLKYADKDAEAFAQVAGEGAARKVLLNENATASNVRFALEEMKASVTEDDVVAIFLAGHGTVDAAGNYYMLLHDSDVADLGNTALPWDDFVAALKSIRAKLVMVFADTCHSGSITGQESVNTLIDRLNRKAGVVVFTASRGDEASIEREDWGHGAFTKALLEGFGGEADTYPKDKQVSLAELRDYVIQRVEELTSGRQHPYLPRLQEFDPSRPICNVMPGAA